MKKLLLVCMMALGIGSYAQTTVTIGTGTTATSGTNGTPIYRSSASSSFNYSQSVQLLTAADMAAAGIPPGATITKIAYYKTNAETLTAGRTATMNLFMKNSSATALNNSTNFATWTTGSTNVYSNTTFGSAATDLPAAAGWVEFTLSTPFLYSGGSLETALDWEINTGTGNPSTGAFSWQYTTATANQAAGTSSSTPITGNLSTANARIYNTQLTYTVVACSGTPAPGNTLSSGTPTCPGDYSTTLTVQNATPGSGVTYQWYQNGTAIAGATSASYTTDVSAADSFYVAVTCGGITTNSTPVTVTAPLTAFVPTYTNDFTTFPGTCWSTASGGTPVTGPTATTGTTYWTADGFLNSGSTGAAKINLYNINRTGWLISPVINLSAGGYRVEFDYGVTDYANTDPITAMGSDDIVNFLISTDGGTTWTVLQTWDANNTPTNTSTTYSYIIPASSSVANAKFAFYATDGTVNDVPDYEFFVDNFIVETVPTCIEPTAVTVTGQTSSSGTLTWTAPVTTGAPPLNYTVYYNTTGTAPTATTVLDGTNSTVITGTTGTITGLTPSTTYYVWIRTNCTATDISAWTPNSVTFITDCLAPAVLTVTGQTVCVNNPATLAATADTGAIINWYDAATGGTPLATGVSFTTPSLTATTTYYVSAANIINGTVGPLNPAAVGATSATNFAITTYYQEFDVIQPTTLVSIDVFPASTVTIGTNASIEIRDNTGTVLHTVPYTVAVNDGTTAQTVPINFQLAVGTDYRIGQGVGGNINLTRSTSGATYPYTSSSINITGNNFDPAYWYYIYNWNFTEGCESARTPVTATVNSDPSCSMATVETDAKDSVSVYPNPFTDVLNIADAEDVASVTVTDMAGRTVKVFGKATEELHLAELRAGMYIITLKMKDGSSKAVKAIKR